MENEILPSGMYQNQEINSERLISLIESGERNFFGAVFVGEFSGIDISEMIGCDEELNFSNTDWSRADEINCCVFDDCNFTNSNFSDIDIDDLSATNSNFSGSTFNNSSVVNSIFSNSNFSSIHSTDSTFDECDFRYVDFSGSHFENLEFRNSNMRKVKFDGVENMPNIVGSFNAPVEIDALEVENSSEHEEYENIDNLNLIGYNTMRTILSMEGLAQEDIENLQNAMLSSELESGATSLSQEAAMISRSGLANFTANIDAPETFFIKFLRSSVANNPEHIDAIQEFFSFNGFTEKLQELDLDDLKDLHESFKGVNYKKLGKSIAKFFADSIADEIERRPEELHGAIEEVLFLTPNDFIEKLFDEKGNVLRMLRVSDDSINSVKSFFIEDNPYYLQDIPCRDFSFLLQHMNTQIMLSNDIISEDAMERVNRFREIGNAKLAERNTVLEQ